MSPFRNILKLSIGDFAAKAAYFLAFVYMAQKLGVERYGVLEFALAVRTYLLLLADAGLELWAIREAAKGEDPLRLTSRVIPGRLALAVFALLVTGVLALTPGNPHFRRVLPLLTLTVLIQAFNLKWVFMGRERMTRVAIGLVASQLVFAACAVMLVHQPSDLILVPLAFLASELVIAVYFWRLFVRTYGRPVLGPDWSSLRSMARPVLTLGAAQCLGLMNYNVDSILIGVMLGPGPVGWYAAAYKPITAALTVVVTYYQGLFPALSRSYHEDREKFRAILLRSLRFTAMFAIPLGVGRIAAGATGDPPVVWPQLRRQRATAPTAFVVGRAGDAAREFPLSAECRRKAAARPDLRGSRRRAECDSESAADSALRDCGCRVGHARVGDRVVPSGPLSVCPPRPGSPAIDGVLAARAGGMRNGGGFVLAGEVAWVPRAGLSLAVYGLILILVRLNPNWRGLWFSPGRVAVGSGQ